MNTRINVVRVMVEEGLERNTIDPPSGRRHVQDQSGEGQQSPSEDETTRKQNEEEVPPAENQPAAHKFEEAQTENQPAIDEIEEGQTENEVDQESATNVRRKRHHRSPLSEGDLRKEVLKIKPPRL